MTKNYQKGPQNFHIPIMLHHQKRKKNIEIICHTIICNHKQKKNKRRKILCFSFLPFLLSIFSLLFFLFFNLQSGNEKKSSRTHVDYDLKTEKKHRNNKNTKIGSNSNKNKKSRKNCTLTSQRKLSHTEQAGTLSLYGCIISFLNVSSMQG